MGIISGPGSFADPYSTYEGTRPHNFRTEFPENYLIIWLQTEISGFSGQMVSTL